MRKTTYNINERKPIWISLSEFYLDTELDKADFRNIAFKIIESPYSLQEVKRINKYEVFPILQRNLLSIAGEWSGFNEKWLVKEIIKNIENRTWLKTLKIKMDYRIYKWMCKDYWIKLEKEYNMIKENPNSYIVNCKIAYQNNIEPFQFNKTENEIYIKLDEIVTKYRETKAIEDFYSYLQEEQYWINVWTAFFLLEKYDINPNDKLKGLNNENIFEFCINEIEQHISYFKTEKQKNDCKKWIIEKKNVTQQPVS